MPCIKVIWSASVISKFVPTIIFLTHNLLVTPISLKIHLLVSFPTYSHSSKWLSSKTFPCQYFVSFLISPFEALTYFNTFSVISLSDSIKFWKFWKSVGVNFFLLLAKVFFSCGEFYLIWIPYTVFNPFISCSRLSLMSIKIMLHSTNCWILSDSIDSVKISSSWSCFEISEPHLSLWGLGSTFE